MPHHFSLFPKNKNNAALSAHEKVGRDILQLLTEPWKAWAWRSVLSWEVFSAIFLTPNPKLVAGMRHALQIGFENLYDSLIEEDLDKEAIQKAQYFIHHCLCLYPFTNPDPNEIFKLPQYINDKWQLVSYLPHGIELTPTEGFERLFLRDKDRVFAWGLEPLNNAADPHLVFMGTTYPAGQGFHSTLHADLKAFNMVGEKLYKTGRERILDWYKMHGNNKKIHVSGTSLGGALSLLFATDQRDIVSRVIALNPPGDISRVFHRHSPNGPDEYHCLVEEDPEILIFRNEQDPVSKFGNFNNSSRLISVTPKTSFSNSILAHAMICSGWPDIEFNTLDVQKDNHKRRFFNTFFIYTLLRSAIYYLIYFPGRFFILPLYRFVMRHKYMLVASGLFITLIVLAGLSLPMLFPGIIVSFSAGYVIENLISFFIALGQKKPNSDLLKFFMAFLSLSFSGKITTTALLLMLSLLLVALVALYAFFIIPTTVPVAAFSIALAIACLPLMLKLSVFFFDTIQQLIGISEPKHLISEVPRKPELDIYSLQGTEDFPYEKIKAYYQLKREIIGQKTLIPTSERQNNNCMFYDKNNNPISKKTLLQNQENRFEDSAIVKVSGSIAKIFHIKRLTSCKKKKKEEIKKLDKAYRDGRHGRCNINSNFLAPPKENELEMEHQAPNINIITMPS